MKKFRKAAGWIWIGVLVALGLLVYFGIHGFSFTAYILFGIAGVILCYKILAALKGKHPKAAKVLFCILSAGLFLGGIAAVITGIPIAIAMGGSEEPCQYMIVLGAGINGTVPSLSLRNRLDAAYEYLSAHPETICIVSGGQGPGEDLSEALCMYKDLTSKGIATERIWMEDQSTSTRENIAFSLALIEEKTGQRPAKAGILSSEYHLYRAGLVAKSQGLEMIGIPARTSWAALRINYFLREIVAVWYYTLLGG